MVHTDGSRPLEQPTFIYKPSPLLTPSYTEKPQAFVDLLQFIFQTHSPTWPDCCQLLIALFSTKDHQGVLAIATMWLGENPLQAPSIQVLMLDSSSLRRT